MEKGKRALLLTTFRGKRSGDFKWIVGNYYHNSVYDDDYIVTADGRAHPVERYTVDIRVDGIYDKNGKEVFVGDFLEVVYPSKTVCGEVVYDAGVFVLEDAEGRQHDIAPLSRRVLEVIGNAHDRVKKIEV